MMAVDTYAEQGNSAISDPVEDIIKHKVNTPPPPFFFKMWIKLKQAFFTGNTEKFGCCRKRACKVTMHELQTKSQHVIFPYANA